MFGLIIGLPAPRLRTFYFAITTLGFATIVTQMRSPGRAGGGVDSPGPVFPPPFDSQWGFYYLCFGIAAIRTWMTMNIAASRFGRALTAKCMFGTLQGRLPHTAGLGRSQTPAPSKAVPQQLRENAR